LVRSQPFAGSNRDFILSFSSQDAAFIRQQTLRAISSNRAPGMHFAGYFLNFTRQKYDTGGVEFTIEPGPHCTDRDGNVNRAALLYMADMSLAGANRVFADPNSRTATLMLRVEFTGEPARGRLTAIGKGSGFSPRTALPESVAAGRVTSEGREVMRMSGTWVSPPAPAGVVMRGLPWEGGEDGNERPLLKKSDLEVVEKAAIRRVEGALRTAENGDLLAALCKPVVKRTAQGASGRLAVGLHIGNRVGHVQGGFLIHAALATAEAAVPQHPLITGASAWYISPGQGKVISARSVVLQSGRNVAVVRTELFNAGRKLVLEVVSNHAVGVQG
jgi:acyl-coenzyme A thioesterase PaaI-like protein